MSDLVKRMRGLAEMLRPEHTKSEAGLDLWCDEAANEIERRRDQLAKAKEALTWIADLYPDGSNIYGAIDQASRSLNELADENKS